MPDDTLLAGPHACCCSASIRLRHGCERDTASAGSAAAHRRRAQETGDRPLLDRGLIGKERKRVLGVFPATTLPAADTRHERELRYRVRAVLEDGASPDTRTAAVTALLSASGTLPALHPSPRWSSTVCKRGKELENGNWGANADSTAVSRTAAAIAASSVAAATTSR
ncbi:GPP34 family phosphoprotein [Saccharomonospora sp. NPDC006951]